MEAPVGKRRVTLLVVRDLWVAPPSAPDPVVRGVSLEVGRGEWLALIVEKHVDQHVG